jgi:hypothetical protein
LKLRRRISLTPEQKDSITKLYTNHSAHEIADLLGLSYNQVYTFAQKQGLSKSLEWIRERARLRSAQPDHGGRRFQFSKGHSTWNKGKKGLSFGGQATQFKKGNLPHNHKPVGHVRKNIDGYFEIKVAEPNVFSFLHRVIWEQSNGPIPRNMVLVFKDRDRTNCILENLELISRADLARRNSMHDKFTPEVRALIHQIGGLRRRINTKRGKQNAQK